MMSVEYAEYSSMALVPHANTRAMIAHCVCLHPHYC